jgi:hypothetical protein
VLKNGYQAEKIQQKNNGPTIHIPGFGDIHNIGYATPRLSKCLKFLADSGYAGKISPIA